MDILMCAKSLKYSLRAILSWRFVCKRVERAVAVGYLDALHCPLFDDGLSRRTCLVRMCVNECCERITLYGTRVVRSPLRSFIQYCDVNHFKRLVSYIHLVVIWEWAVK